MTCQLSGATHDLGDSSNDDARTLQMDVRLAAVGAGAGTAAGGPSSGPPSALSSCTCSQVIVRLMPVNGGHSSSFSIGKPEPTASDSTAPATSLCGRAPRGRVAVGDVLFATPATTLCE